MTRDDIIRMAQEAGIYHGFDSEGQWDGLTDVKLFEIYPHPKDKIYGEKRIVEILERFFHMAQAAEREACAKVCEENADDGTEGDWDSACISCAKHIIARGEQ